MEINMRGQHIIEPGSITAAHLADGAVDLSSSKVVGILPVSKAADQLKTSLLVADDNQVSSVGLTEVTQKTVEFFKNAGINGMVRLKCALKLSSSDVLHQAEVKIYVDGEPAPRLTFSTTSTGFANLSGEFDISDLGEGGHSLQIKTSNTDAATTTTLDLTEVYMTA